MVAGIIFMKDPLFKGRDNYDQLVKIAQVLGTAKLGEYLEKYNLQLDSHFDGILGAHAVTPWSEFVNPDNAKFVTTEALDFIDQLLRYDHQERMTAQEAMAHAYLKPAIEEDRARKAKKAAGAAAAPAS